jgi:hypothetical protein
MPVKQRTLTYAQVVQDILFSTESMTRLIEGDYILLLQRTADPYGFNAWLQLLQPGTHFASNAEAIMASPEFFNNAAMSG